MCEVTRGNGTVLDDKHAIVPFRFLELSSLDEYFEALEIELFPSEKLREVLITFSYGKLNLEDVDLANLLSHYIGRLRHREKRCERWLTCKICQPTCGHLITDVSKLGENKAFKGPAGLLGLCRKCYHTLVENLSIRNKKGIILPKLTDEQQAVVFIVYGSLVLPTPARAARIARVRYKRQEKKTLQELNFHGLKKNPNSTPKREKRQKSPNRENVIRDKRKDWHH